MSAATQSLKARTTRASEYINPRTVLARFGGNTAERLFALDALQEGNGLCSAQRPS